MATASTDRESTWHVRTWDTLGWLETAAKGVGIATALAGAIDTGASASVSVGGVGYGLVVLASLLALGSILQLGLRVAQKEVISLGFAVANLVGHGALLWVVLTAPDVAWAPAGFGLAYVVGELVKQRFLAQTGYTENGQTSQQMQRMSQLVAGLYLFLVVLSIVR